MNETVLNEANLKTANLHIYSNYLDKDWPSKTTLWPPNMPY